jgi:hypothetical protein
MYRVLADNRGKTERANLVFLNHAISYFSSKGYIVMPRSFVVVTREKTLLLAVSIYGRHFGEKWKLINEMRPPNLEIGVVYPVFQYAEIEGKRGIELYLDRIALRLGYSPSRLYNDVLPKVFVVENQVEGMFIEGRRGYKSKRIVL